MSNDLLWALKKPQFWLILSWYDIKQRYKRSTLGPFWVTISTGILVGMLSILWSTIFKLDVKNYLPFFCIGQVVWIYISMQLTESCTGFTQFEYLIKQSKVSFSSIILRILIRNLIVFAHNFIIIFIVITFVSPGWTWMALWAMLGFIILTLSLFPMSIILAILCTRFRDLQMIVQNILLVCFYFTPIMWKTHQLSDKLSYIINFNPLVHFFNIIRDPMLGAVPNVNSMFISVSVTIAIFFTSMVFMRKYRVRIAYWL